VSSALSTRAEVEALFDAWTTHEGYPTFSLDEYLRVLTAADRLLIPGCRVADLGCGSGSVSAVLKEMGHHVTGVDLSASALHAALQGRHIDEGLVADSLHTGLQDRAFDVVTCPMLLLYVADLRAQFEEIHRILKPGGQVLIFDHHSRNPYTKAHFSRPDWVDRLLEGRSNVARRPLDEGLVLRAADGLFSFHPPLFLSLYTRHPRKLINAVHAVARAAFCLLRAFTRAPWTGNVIVMVGDRSGEASR
jgi:SAM-dependent methyltransferase